MRRKMKNQNIQMLKMIILSIVLVSTATFCFSQTWTQQQLDSANTAKDETQLTTAEKEALMYLNLARLYPKLFAAIEVRNYFGTTKYVDYVKNSKYRESLIADLNKKVPVQRLHFDDTMFSFAKCLALESGKNGTVGHKRVNCPKVKGAFGECCSYGMETGKDIILQLLIDDQVPDVGHRMTCLDKNYSRIGVSISKHKTWNTCAVLDFTY